MDGVAEILRVIHWLPFQFAVPLLVPYSRVRVDTGVSVGLVYRSVCIMLPSVVSRNVILSVEYSAVNFIVS